MFEVPKQAAMYPQHSEVRVRDSIIVMIKGIYYIHLFVVFLYSTLLMILQPHLRVQFSSTLVIVIVYGFLLVWIFLLDFIAVVLKKQKIAIWCNRFVAKIIIMMFPIFAAVAYLHEYFLLKRSIVTFMIWNLVFSIIMIIFQIYSCTCGHHDKPGYIYTPNQLMQHQQQVSNVRNQYISNQIKKAKSAAI